MKSIKTILLSALIFVCHHSRAQSDAAAFLNDKKAEIRYYYFPNLEAYFDLQEKVYLYKEEGEWLEAAELPTNYGGYSLYNKVRVTIEDYDGDEPYLFLATHKKLYPYNSKGRFQTPKTQTASSD